MLNKVKKSPKRNQIVYYKHAKGRNSIESNQHLDHKLTEESRLNKFILRNRKDIKEFIYLSRQKSKPVTRRKRRDLVLVQLLSKITK